MKKPKTPSFQILKKYQWKVIVAPLLKIFEVVTELLTPFITKYIIDVGLKNNDLPMVLILILVIFLFAIFGFGVTGICQYISSRVAADYSYDLKKAIYHQISSLDEKSLRTFGKDKALTVLNNDAFLLQTGVNVFMRLIFRPPLLLLGSTILAFVIDPWVGLIFLGVLILCCFVFFFVTMVTAKKYPAIQSNLDEISGVADDTLKGMRPVRAFNNEKLEEQKFETSINSYMKKNIKVSLYNALINPVTFFVINLGMVLVVYLANLDIGFGDLTSGDVVSVLSYFAFSLQAITMLSKLIISLNKAYASKKRIDQLLSLKPSIKNDGEKTKFDDKENTIIEFNDVTFSYDPNSPKPTLANISFKLKKGESLGIIGETGAGKSTILSLIDRLYEPKSGEIYFNGTILKDWETTALRDNITFVSQKPALFKGTIKDNLELDKDYSKEEIKTALDDALASEFVNRYSDYIDHEVEEAGANFSGGQKQRLTLARAFLKKAPVLLIDDSMSALDYLSEQKIRTKLLENHELTKIIVSQRATSLSHLDHILVLRHGTIEAYGTHEELLKTSSFYRETYMMQKGETA